MRISDWSSDVCSSDLDLHRVNTVGLIRDALATLIHDREQVIAVNGASPNDPAVDVVVIMDEAPLRAEMLDYSARILQLSLIISFITAALVYLSLRWLLVRPMSRLTRAMVAFAEKPQDSGRIIRPRCRSNEVGIAALRPSYMMHEVRAALHPRGRPLAPVGRA